MMTVGQLARQSGVSVRTLHYYEELGLLKATRSASGYRQYDEGSVIRLQQIAVLKKMCFTLEEIGEILGPHVVTEAARLAEVWERALEQQVTIVQQQQDRLQTVEHLLRSAQYAIRATGRVDLDELLGFIRELDESPKPNRRRRNRFFTPEEQQQLPLNDFDDARVMAWADILRDVQRHMHEAPDSTASQALAVRIDAYAREIFQGDEQLTETFWQYVAPDEGDAAVLYGMTREVMDYIEAILETLYRTRSGAVPERSQLREGDDG
ncbi:MerR family transcriptional regulator [Paenibacillus sp. 598K]|uniref:MerR family transcriptional regulator n=1 Tax=Paenibacillus sp. 598K TaxID=1117987 RepID=UPI000FF970DD|nr:MerR family transcriptional regulator [Paenibacillus sp. 598K]GBF73526.1 MerR family transcriptional regulator [Paenibacillus sp. 598K]